MNLETILPQGMWEAIRTNYEKRDFTSAILDCCYFMSDLLRQKSGVDGDGAPLVGQALGGPNPKIRIAKDQSETEQNIQKGIESIMRGVYQAIRNPRSHKKVNDGADDAICIIMFCGYIVKQIEQAKAPASKEALINRILDKDFVPQERYAQLVVAEIPTGLKMEVFLGVYEKRTDWNVRSVSYFNKAIMSEVLSNERASIIELISEDLKTTENELVIRNVMSGFVPEIWSEVSEVARLRIEHKIIRSIEDGRYDRRSGRCLSGGLATWSLGQFKHFLLQQNLIRAISGKFNSSESQQKDYALRYFVDTFVDFSSEKLGHIERTFIRKLNAGAQEFHEALLFSTWPSKYWSSELKTAFEGFLPKTDSGSDLDDEIPF